MHPVLRSIMFFFFFFGFQQTIKVSKFDVKGETDVPIVGPSHSGGSNLKFNKFEQLNN